MSNHLIKCKFCLKFEGAWGQDTKGAWRLFPVNRQDDGTPILNAKGKVSPNIAQPAHTCTGTGTGKPTDPELPAVSPGEAQEAESSAGESSGEGESQGQGSEQEQEPWKSMAENLKPYIKTGTDEKKVEEIAKKVADKGDLELLKLIGDLEQKMQPGEKELIINLKKDDGEPIKLDGHHHEQFPKLVLAARERIPVLLIGPPGGGKSEANKNLAALFEIPYYELVLGPTDTSSKAIGFFDAQGKVVHTEYRKAWVNGGVLHVEEIDNASAAILTTLNSMWANGVATFPDGQFPKHKDFVLVASANTDLRGGDVNHSQRRPLDAATTDRFLRMRWNYDEVLERKIIQDINPNALSWLEWVKKVRKFSAKHYPKLVVSPRASIKGAILLKQGGWTLEELADGNVFIGGCDQEARNRILAEVSLPTIK